MLLELNCQGGTDLIPLCFQSPSSYSTDGQSELERSSKAVRWEAGRTVGGEERWCCADGTFMMSCITDAWCWKRRDMG